MSTEALIVRQLLGRRVQNRPDRCGIIPIVFDSIRRSRDFLPYKIAKSKIADQRRSIIVKEDIGRLQIAMNNSIATHQKQMKRSTHALLSDRSEAIR